MEKRSMGSFLSALRRAAGMTQQELSEQLNVSNKTVSKWECDESYPDITLLPVLAEFFDVTCDELLAGGRKSSDKRAGPDTKKTLEKARYLHERATRKFQLFSLFAFLTLFLGVIVCFSVSYAAFRPDVGYAVSLCLYAVAVALEVCAVILLGGSLRSGLFDETVVRKAEEMRLRLSYAVFACSLLLPVLTLPLVVLRSPVVTSVLDFGKYFTLLPYLAVMGGLAAAALYVPYRKLLAASLERRSPVPALFCGVRLLLVCVCYGLSYAVSYPGAGSSHATAGGTAGSLLLYLVILGTVLLLTIVVEALLRKRPLAQTLASGLRDFFYLAAPTVSLFSTLLIFSLKPLQMSSSAALNLVTVTICLYVSIVPLLYLAAMKAIGKRGRKTGGTDQKE